MKRKEKDNIEVEDQLEDVSFDDGVDNDNHEESDTPNDEADDFEGKYLEMNDKYLRLYSDFDNFRKRTAKERIDTLKTASQDLMIELLPVLDDFDRALEAMAENNAQEESVKGVELIYNKLFSILKQKGLETMDVGIGDEFDTDFHEAITNIPAPTDDLKGKVIDVIQKGYMLGGKIIRFAKVIVGN